MITIKPKQVYAHKDGERYFVYVFRRGDDVLYVGESKLIWQRLGHHLEGVNSNLSLTEELRKGGDIVIDLYSAQDIVTSAGIEGFIDMCVHADPGCPREFFIISAGCDYRKFFESELIRELKPLCNVRR